MSSEFPIPTGLCGSCRHARRVPNDRGGAFLMCMAHTHNSSLARYPNLPVLSCPEYHPLTQEKPASMNAAPKEAAKGSRPG